MASLLTHIPAATISARSKNWSTGSAVGKSNLAKNKMAEFFLAKNKMAEIVFGEKQNGGKNSEN
jgi:hypothetical protein